MVCASGPEEFSDVSSPTCRRAPEGRRGHAPACGRPWPSFGPEGPPMSKGLQHIVDALGGDLYDGNMRASVPGPNHSADDRSVSLLLQDGRVVVNTYGRSDWKEVLDDLRERGLIDRNRADRRAGRARDLPSGSPSGHRSRTPRGGPTLLGRRPSVGDQPRRSALSLAGADRAPARPAGATLPA
jgi:hypothetical protein